MEMTKNKKLLIICIAAVVLIAAAVIIVVVVQNNTGLDSYTRQMKNSMQGVTSVESTVSMHEGETLVYEYQRKVNVTTIGGADITIEESTLGANFAMQTTTTSSSVDSLDKSTLLNVNVKKDLLDSYKGSGDALTMVVKEENLADVLGVASLSVSGDAQFEFTFSNKTLTGVTCSFVTDSGRNVLITVVYKY